MGDPQFEQQQAEAQAIGQAINDRIARELGRAVMDRIAAEVSAEVARGKASAALARAAVPVVKPKSRRRT